MMDRRAFITILGGGILAAPLVAEAEAPGTQQHRIGFLNAAAPGGRGQPEGVLREALRSLGYVEGANLVIDAKAAHGIVERLPALTRQLLDAKPEVIVTFGTTAAQAAKAATTTTPIVMAFAGDPVGTRLVASLARPGGNVTGMSLVASELISWQATRASRGDHPEADPSHYFGRHLARGRGTRNRKGGACARLDCGPG